MAIVKIIILAAMLNVITCRSAVEYRHLPSVPSTYVQYPSYNIREPNGPGTYAFGYEIDDAATGNVQFRDEERMLNGTVQGSFGHVRPDGIVTLTRFIADSAGYRSDTQTFHRTVDHHPLHPHSPVTTKMPTTRPITTEIPFNEISYNQPSLTAEQAADILHNYDVDVNPPSDPFSDQNVIDPNVETLLGESQSQISPSRIGKGKFSVQFVNNFIPSNYPVVNFNSPSASAQFPVEEAVEEELDPVETSTFVNDKFHDPIFDERKNFDNRKQTLYRKRMPHRYQSVQNRRPGAGHHTREALWFRELIQNRRMEYLQKYLTNYDLHTIPASFTISN